MRFLLLTLALFWGFQATAAITVSGTVTDQNGVPVKKCDVFFNKLAWIADDSVHVQCDENGFYTAEIEPGLYNSVYVCDEELYGKTKLEFWGWNLELRESQTLDAQFDTMEVFSLATWVNNGGGNSMFASFRPMSLAKAKTPKFSSVEVNGKKVTLFDIAPSLTTESINVFIDEKPVSIMSMQWTYEKVPSCTGAPDEIDTKNGCYMSMVLLQLEKPKMLAGLHKLKVDIRDHETGEFGQGITHFTSNKSRLGF